MQLTQLYNDLYNAQYCGTSNLKQSTGAAALVISHVSGRGAELCVSFDHFVDCVKKVFLCGNLQGKPQYHKTHMSMVTVHHNVIYH